MGVVADDSDLLVKTSGVCMSTLLYEQIKSHSDSGGFLVGHVKTIVSEAISDHSANDISQQTIFEITKIISCHESSLWYDRKCHIKTNALENLLKSVSAKKEEILGWYRSRKESSLLVSLKEGCLTSRLQKYFSSSYFIFLLMTSNNSLTEERPIQCIHTYDFQFFVQKNDRTSLSPCVKVTNLGGSPEQEYRMTPSISFPISTLPSICQVANSSLVDTINSTCNQLIMKSEELKKALIESEDKLVHESKKLIELRRELHFLRPHKQNASLLHSCPQVPGELLGEHLIDLNMDCPLMPGDSQKVPASIESNTPSTHCLLTSPIPDNLNLEKSIFVPNSLIESSL